jgi:hypothetical protein
LNAELLVDPVVIERVGVSHGSGSFYCDLPSLEERFKACHYDHSWFSARLESC